MRIKPYEIVNEYRDGTNFKASLGNKGLFEQTKINERFYMGDQWHGAKCGNDRPLVRHNVIKRIGDYKIAQVLSKPFEIEFSAEGIPSMRLDNQTGSETDEINGVLNSFNKYFITTAERLKLSYLNDKILKNAYISGTSLVYTYWDSSVQTGLYADDAKTVKIKGDICAQVLDIRNVVFGDPYCDDVQNQPYIIISRMVETEEVIREARVNGATIDTLRVIEESSQDGKIEVFTKLYKSLLPNGEITVKCVKVTEKAVVRNEFLTGLRLYPMAAFCWENRSDLAYGESEVTYLIPNQIAINRMITANVWSAMTTGMPIMVVNGDTVTDKITNEPGQIVKVYGSNEDVAGAVKYVTPPNVTKDFDSSINTLIENTMTQSGANEVALGDSRADNATALATMREAALTPLQIIKNRFYIFAEDLARIWADFWITYYGKRNLKIATANGTEYIPFDSSRYKNLILNAKVDVVNSTLYSDSEQISVLLNLFEKGIINKQELLERMPEGSIKNRKQLLLKGEEK